MTIPQIDVDVAKAHLDADTATFVDIRDPYSFESGHVPGAVHLTDANVQDFLDGTDRDRTVVVYCYHGNTSLAGADFLLQHGFEDVFSMSGGFEAWRGRHPHETGGAS